MSDDLRSVEIDLSPEGFLYYAFIVFVTLNIISYGVKFILNRSSSLDPADVSLISRRVAAISIYLVVFLILLQSAFICYKSNRFLNPHLPPPSSREFWPQNKIPRHFEHEGSRLYFFATKTSMTFSGYSESKILLTLALTINAAFNAIDLALMYFWGRGFSAEHSTLLMFHHWTIIWVESTIFNLELLSVHPDWIWMFTIIGMLMICGCIWDLILSPSTMQCVVSGKSEIYRKILWIHLLINVVLFRATGVSLIAFDFIVNMWQWDWKYGAAFHITLIFMWLQWLNLGKAIFHKLSNW